MKRRYSILAALAAVLIFAAAIKPAMSYFTTYAKASGGLMIRIGDETQIHETFVEQEKTLTITNNEEDSQEVYVRARGTAPGGFTLTYTGENWTPGEGGWYYYGAILNPGDTASPLRVGIDGVPAQEVHVGDSFDIIVYYETTPVEYNDDGTPKEPNWEIRLDTYEERGGN